MVRLDGKAVVVTGSGRGIGAACAAHGAGLGARVVVNDIDGAAARPVTAGIRATGGEAPAHTADASVRVEAAGLVRRRLDGVGRIDAERWTVDDVTHAFASVLDATLSPAGLAVP